MGNLLDFQEEVDKHNTCLWAINDQNVKIEDVLKKGKDPPKSRPMFEEQPGLQIDEECQACSVARSRPIVKEAFKMACLNYKPSRVPFQGTMYRRKDLLEFRE